MRLKVSRNAAQERIVTLLTEGYTLRLKAHGEYTEAAGRGTFDKTADVSRWRGEFSAWVTKVHASLEEIFPTCMEALEFVAHESFNKVDYQGIDQDFGRLYYRDWELYLKRLTAIRDTQLDKYTDLPTGLRLFIGDIDSFAKVRDVDWASVAHHLTDGYFLDIPEDRVKDAVRVILGVGFRQKHSPAELNDLVAEVEVNGSRRVAAFMLKGPGTGRKEMDIHDCGKKGNQLVKLFDSPATLFVVQFVGKITEMVIKDVEGKTELLRSQGKEAHYLIMEGEETARLLHAYGKL